MFALDPELLDHAARRVDAVAASLASLDAGGPLTEVGCAVSGSATGAACSWVAAGLDAAVEGWAALLLDLSAAATAVSRDAAETDEEVAAAFATREVGEP